VPNFIQRKVVVRFIPEAEQGAIRMVRGEHHGANHETFFAVGQVLEWNVYRNRRATPVVELDDNASRVFANQRLATRSSRGNGNY
jgi:hypothetical protein